MNVPAPHSPPSERLFFRTWQETDLATSLWTHPEVMQFLGGTDSRRPPSTVCT